MRPPGAGRPGAGLPEDAERQERQQCEPVLEYLAADCRLVHVRRQRGHGFSRCDGRDWATPEGSLPGRKSAAAAKNCGAKWQGGMRAVIAPPPPSPEEPPKETSTPPRDGR